ncbi:DUF4097 family beta strand repeat-containing protein [Ligilactobacillus equi]|uniref:DUF4097 domain-containing protein n=1 Tax=Ligilactobacillus equi DSM 15833 = JCM 10991 TaxID=1423740 RepID=A0A0R1TWX9_9LACO|nr:DUF4097 family beta strand repeat-containing protein [Ligilactobacillus equi]KRL83283.1 hypothetical protein FC36_GL000326 [Ligilactobacillus equi DSM 15833 = JCM 10991]
MKRYVFSLVIAMTVLLSCVVKVKASQNYSNQDFNSIQIEADMAKVTVKTGDKYQVKYRGKQKFTPQVSQFNKRLIIKQEVRDSRQDQNNQIIVIVPTKTPLTKLDVEADVGDILVQGLSLSKHSELSTEAGNITVKKLRVKRGLELQADTGNIRSLHTTFSGYHLEAETGTVSLNNQDKGGTYRKKQHSNNVLEAETEAGNIEITK